MNPQERWTGTWVLVLAFVLAFATTGCKKEEPAAPAPVSESKAIETEVEAPPASDPVDMAEVSAILAKADAVDGATDKVIGRCLMCALRMDGSAEIETEYEGYTLRFCNQVCLDTFKEDPATWITEIPFDFDKVGE
jgi:YHS domain-containing protein